MGWTQYRESKTRDEALAQCRRLCEWENDANAYRVLAEGITGHGDNMGYYAATECTDKATGEREVFCAVFLISLCPFGYKDMTDNMGPRIHAAPREVLEALEPLPARAPKDCTSCGGSGKLTGTQWRADAQGSDCYFCDGSGQVDRYDSARRWRKDAWARFGGEPQGQQLALAV